MATREESCLKHAGSQVRYLRGVATAVAWVPVVKRLLPLKWVRAKSIVTLLHVHADIFCLAACARVQIKRPQMDIRSHGLEKAW